jgi:hypothetical protein
MAHETSGRNLEAAAKPAQDMVSQESLSIVP